MSAGTALLLFIALMLAFVLFLVFTLWKDKWRWLTLLCFLPLLFVGLPLAAEGKLFGNAHALILVILWSPAPFGIVGVIWLARFCAQRSDRRIRTGRCPRCNYRLDGHLSAGCPECGWKRDKAKA